MFVKINMTFFEGKDFCLTAITRLVGEVSEGMQVAVCGLRAEAITRCRSPANAVN